MLDFNAIQQPTWSIKLKDDGQTVVNIATPTVELVDRLMAATPELQEAAKSKDGRTIRAIYELIAELMSCNEDGYTFTADELRDTYRMTLLDVFRFVGGYMDFLKEMQDAKN
jgi:integrase